MSNRTEVMCNLYREGKSLQQIGDIYGLSRERIRQLLKRTGITRFEGGFAVAQPLKQQKRKTARDARFIARHGHDWKTHQEFLAMGKTAKSCNTSPLGAFRGQRSNAAARGIGWKLLFSEWWAIWEASGKWKDRGRGHQYVMSRKGDTGPYAVGNVFIQKGCDNNSKTARKRSALPKGVHRASTGKFYAMRMDKGKMAYLGTYPTVAEAKEAYEYGIPT